MNARRLITTCIIVLISYFYFRFFGIQNHSLAHYLFSAFIMGSLAVAFITKKKDITMGILYGLIFLLISLIALFVFL